MENVIAYHKKLRSHVHQKAVIKSVLGDLFLEDVLGVDKQYK